MDKKKYMTMKRSILEKTTESLSVNTQLTKLSTLFSLMEEINNDEEYVIILHEGGDDEKKIEALAKQYIERFDQEGVLRIDG